MHALVPPLSCTRHRPRPLGLESRRSCPEFPLPAPYHDANVGDTLTRGAADLAGASDR